MSNPDFFPAMAQEPGRRWRSARIPAAIVLGMLALVFVYSRFGLAAAYLVLLVMLLTAVALGPSKLRRPLGLFYSVLFLGIVTALAIERVSGRSFSAALVPGLAVGLFSVLAFLVASAWLSSDLILVLSQTSGMSRLDALRCLGLMTLGVWCPWAIVEDGEVKKVRPEGLLQTPLGPGIVVIRPGNAAVFEWGGKVTKIEGPGVTKSKRYEIIKKVVDLRPHWLPVTAENVLTQDRIPLTFEMTVGYQVQPKAETDKTGPPTPTIAVSGGEIAGDYPVYKESVYRSVFKLDPATPEKAVRATADSFLRDAVRAFNLDGLYDYSVADNVRARGDAILALERAVKARLEPQLGEWGLALLSVDITTVVMPENVREKVLDWWVTAWQRECVLAEAKADRRAMEERGEGQARAFEAVERRKSQFRENLARQLMEMVFSLAGAGIALDPKVGVRLVSVLEAVSNRMSCDSPTALKYLDALEKLLQSEGDKTLIVSGAPPLMIRGDERTPG
jgi:regulator of protease activity HflC (stomatin/prohibitin superfamily)